MSGMEIAMWQYRWTNPANEQDEYSLETAAKWEAVEPRDYIQTLDQRLEELRSYRFDGKPCYEVRALGVIADGVKEGANG
jgi:hypothetical protein